MSSVELGDSFKLEGYFIVITTARRRGVWWAWAEFEQDLEYGERCVHVPVFRHRVPGTYSTKLASIEAGSEYAYRTLAEGTIVIH